AGLEEEDVGAADRLEVAAVRLAVSKGLELDLAELDPEVARDRVGQVGMRAAGEDHQPLLRSALDPVPHRGRRYDLWRLGCLEPREGDRLSHLLGFRARRRRTLPSSPGAARSLQASPAARRL